MMASTDKPQPLDPTMVVDDVTIAPLSPIGVSVRVAAQLIGLSERTLSSIIANNELATVKIGNRRIVPVKSLMDWFSQQHD